MPFSFLLQAHVPDSHKCCMSLWRAWGEKEERRRGSTEKEDRIARGKRKERRRREEQEGLHVCGCSGGKKQLG